jgi:hypothetical protein
MALVLSTWGLIWQFKILTAAEAKAFHFQTVPAANPAGGQGNPR